MRLICPNCGAQYAVADGVIPTGGRDVQCSNCAHTWFETPGASSNDQPPEPRKVATPTPPAADPNDLYSGSIDDAFKKADEEPDIAPAPQPPVDRKPVDRSVSDILREEAALETAQRRTEIGGNLESQSDLGLRDPAPEPPKQPIASQPNLAPAATATAATAATIAAASASSRSELLPDIEEINSSLQSNSERDNAGALGEEAAVETKRRSFRRGFMTVLLIILILVLVYIYAEQIATMAPTLTDTLKSYVDAVDVGRIWLDDNVQAMLAYIAVEQP